MNDRTFVKCTTMFWKIAMNANRRTYVVTGMSIEMVVMNADVFMVQTMLEQRKKKTNGRSLVNVFVENTSHIFIYHFTKNSIVVVLFLRDLKILWQLTSSFSSLTSNSKFIYLRQEKELCTETRKLTPVKTNDIATEKQYCERENAAQIRFLVTSYRIF